MSQNGVGKVMFVFVTKFKIRKLMNKVNKYMSEEKYDKVHLTEINTEFAKLEELAYSPHLDSIMEPLLHLENLVYDYRDEFSKGKSDQSNGTMSGPSPNEVILNNVKSVVGSYLTGGPKLWYKDDVMSFRGVNSVKEDVKNFVFDFEVFKRKYSVYEQESEDVFEKYLNVHKDYKRLAERVYNERTKLSELYSYARKYTDNMNHIFNIGNNEFLLRYFSVKSDIETTIEEINHMFYYGTEDEKDMYSGPLGDLNRILDEMAKKYNILTAKDEKVEFNRKSMVKTRYPKFEDLYQESLNFIALPAEMRTTVLFDKLFARIKDAIIEIDKIIKQDSNEEIKEYKKKIRGIKIHVVRQYQEYKS